jgi:hypothetical protein
MKEWFWLFSVSAPIDSSDDVNRLLLNDLCCMYSSEESAMNGFRLVESTNPGDPEKCLLALLFPCPNGTGGGDATSMLSVVRLDYILNVSFPSIL